MDNPIFVELAFYSIICFVVLYGIAYFRLWIKGILQKRDDKNKKTHWLLYKPPAYRCRCCVRKLNTEEEAKLKKEVFLKKWSDLDMMEFGKFCQDPFFIKKGYSIDVLWGIFSVRLSREKEKSNV